MDKRYYTTTQAAHLLAVSADTVLKWVRQGKISSYRTPGGHARIPREAIETLLPTKTMPGDIPVKAPDFHYCWEFYGNGGTVTDECQNCVVFRSGARRCYEMRDIPEQFGNLKLHCQSDCENCDYFDMVSGQFTSVLIVSRNTTLQDTLRREAQGHEVNVRFAASEYECSAVLDKYRPDYVVIDCAIGQSRTREMCRHLSGDERIPFTKIILTSRTDIVKDCYEGRIFGWIKKPFSFDQLRCCLGQAE